MLKYFKKIWPMIILLTACVTSPTSIDRNVYQIHVPREDWVMELSTIGLKKEVADETAHYYFTNPKLDMTISINFDQRGKCSDAESCRDYFVNTMKVGYPDKTNWRIDRIDDIYISENMDPPIIQGMVIRLQHMNAHYVRNGIWIDVHLSKINYKESDRELFLDFIRSIRFKSKS